MSTRENTLTGDEVDELLLLLADETRRQVLSVLDQRRDDGPTSVATLRTTATGNEITLQHVHLPKLAAADVVEWVPEDGQVRRGPAFDHARELLTVLAQYGTAPAPQQGETAE